MQSVVVEQRVCSSWVQQWGMGKYGTQTCPWTWSWQICWRRGLVLALWKTKTKKKHADIWRALKPLTFTAWALKPSTSIKSVKRERQRRQLRETEEGKSKEWKGKKGCREKERESERWVVGLSHKLHLTFDHCLHDNELHSHTYIQCVYICYIEGL